MDYGALPPEINSARIYSGPGSTPMLAAVAAWEGLAAELSSTAASYQSVIERLADEGWLGPASVSMAVAVTPYMTWMSRTGAQAEQAASQASSAAAAFEAAYAATVPPAAVAANRAQLATLVATNFLGLNTAAIAATEAHYSEMWAQDAVAMYAYAASSATASLLKQFKQPPQTTNPTGQADQAAAVAQASGTPAASGAQTITESAVVLDFECAAITLVAGSGIVAGLAVRPVELLGLQLRQRIRLSRVHQPRHHPTDRHRIDGRPQRGGDRRSARVHRTATHGRRHRQCDVAADSDAKRGGKLPSDAVGVSRPIGGGPGRAFGGNWLEACSSAGCLCPRAGPLPPRWRTMRARRSRAAGGTAPRSRRIRRAACPACRGFPLRTRPGVTSAAGRDMASK